MSKNKVNTNIIEFKTIINEDGYEENDLSEFLKNEGDMNYNMPGWLWGHFSVKYVFTLLGKKLKIFEPKSRAEILELVKATNIVLDFLHNHHGHEETLIWNWLIERAPESKDKFTEINKQHSEWDQLYKEIVEKLKIINENQELVDQNSNGWNDILKELQINFQKQIDIIYKNFFDEERLVIPIVVGIPKSDQNKLGDRMNSIMKDEPISRFIIGAILNAAKTNKDLSDSVNNTIPALVRKVIFPLALEKSYRWFGEFVTTTSN